MTGASTPGKSEGQLVAGGPVAGRDPRQTAWGGICEVLVQLKRLQYFGGVLQQQDMLAECIALWMPQRCTHRHVAIAEQVHLELPAQLVESSANPRAKDDGLAANLSHPRWIILRLLEDRWWQRLFASARLD